MHLLAFTVVILVVGMLLAAALFLLRRIRLTPVCVMAAIVAGFLTDYIARAAIHLVIRPRADWYDYADWAYNGLFGLSTRFARIFRPDYAPIDEWILPGDEVAVSAHFWFHVILWTCIFAVTYFVAVRRPRRTI